MNTFKKAGIIGSEDPHIRRGANRKNFTGKSVRQHCADLLSCRIIVVFDTYDRIGPVSRLKKGVVTEEGAQQYDAYRKNVKTLVLGTYGHSSNVELAQEQGEAEYGFDGRAALNLTPFTVNSTKDDKVAFVEPAERLGFGLAVRTALRITTTPYVWVHQHDWTLVADIPIAPVLDIMKATDEDEEAPVKYICLASVRMLDELMDRVAPAGLCTIAGKWAILPSDLTSS
ncbi:hypothetical protein K4K56_000528 [Colletotrichum sp. SAR 10_98]|nr:hypothetical protein K4K56_000528 [Colletotrichum sp. SAR 10_98]